MCQRRFNGKRQRGATLPEMLVTVALVAATCAIALPLYTKSITAKDQDTDDAQMQTIVQAEEAYRIRNRTFTANLSDMGYSKLTVPGDNSGSTTAPYIISVNTTAGKHAFTITTNRCGTYVSGYKRRLQYDEDGIAVTSNGTTSYETTVINNDVPCTQ